MPEPTPAPEPFAAPAAPPATAEDPALETLLASLLEALANPASDPTTDAAPAPAVPRGPDGATPPPASGGRLVIRGVDTSRFPRVSVVAQAIGGPAAPAFSLEENGETVGELGVAPVAQTPARTGVVLAIDTSASMGGDALAQAKEAAHRFVANRLPNDRIAVVAFGGTARVVAGLTDDAAALDAAVDGLVAEGGTALWDGLSASAGLLRADPSTQPNVVVLSGGEDTASQATADDARAAATAIDAAVYAVGLPGDGPDAAVLEGLARETDGAHAETARPGALVALYAAVQHALQAQYRIDYASRARDSLDLSLSASGIAAPARATVALDAAPVLAPDPLAAAAAATATAGAPPSPGTTRVASAGLLGGAPAKALAAGLVALALGSLAWVALRVLMRETSHLEAALRPYARDRTREVAEEERPGKVSIVGTALGRRVAAAAGRQARLRGVLEWLDRRLDQADLPVKAAEALVVWLAAVVLAVALAWVLLGPIGALLASLLAGLAPRAALSLLAARRLRRFVALLPETLQMTASTLRAGYSLQQGVDAVAKQVGEPMAAELHRVLAEARLGRPVEQALDEAAARLDNPDFAWAVMAVRIQREVGGNLAELLDTVSETMVHRERLRREVKSLTAEGRMSAIVLGILPVGLGAVMYAISPGYVGVLFTDGTGKAMLGLATLLALGGFFWMKRMIEVDV